MEKQPNTRFDNEELSHLDHEDLQLLDELVKQATAESTRSEQKYQWTKYERFCAARGQEALPSPPQRVAAFLSACCDEGSAASSLRSYRSSIAAKHRYAELDNPCDDKKVVKALKALCKRAAKCNGRRHQAAGLTAARFEQIRATAYNRRPHASGFERKVDATRRADVDIALIGLMRDALLRRCEAARAAWEDIEEMSDGSGVLTIPWDKTNQDGADIRVGYISEQTMQYLKRIRPPMFATGPIFGLSARAVGGRITAAGVAAGIEVRLTGHSCRVGMAQDLTASGVEMPALLQAARWTDPKSAARYIAALDAQRGAVAGYYQGI